MNPHVATFNILIFQMTDFANSETGRVHEGNHGFLLQVRNGGDEGLILSRLVDTFFSRILYPMLPLSGNHSIAVV